MSNENEGDVAKEQWQKMAEVYAVLHRVFQKPADDGPIKDQNQGHPMGADQPGLVQPPVGYIQQAGVPPLVAVPQPVGYIQQVTVPPPVAVRQPVGYNQGVAVPQPAGIEPQAYRANYYGYPAPTNQAMAVPHQPGFYMSPYLEPQYQDYWRNRGNYRGRGYFNRGFRRGRGGYDGPYYYPY